jgi:hypothetical protein
MTSVNDEVGSNDVDAVMQTIPENWRHGGVVVRRVHALAWAVCR